MDEASYLNWPQSNIHVSIDPIAVEHGLMGTSGEG